MSRLYIKDVLQNLTNLVVVINKDSSVEYVSPSSEKILGYPPNLLLGEGWWNLTKTSDPERIGIKKHLADLVSTGQVNESDAFERTINTANGTKKWMLWKTSASDSSKMIAIGYDITQRKELELKVKLQQEKLQETTSDLLASLTYASLIQNALLPPIDLVKKFYKDACVFYRPKDIVSGDFYWAAEVEGKLITALIDCTGHGVPGALVTMMANSALEEIVKQNKVTDPAEVLYKLDDKIINNLNNNASEQRSEGMDMSICVLSPKENVLRFSGAYHSLTRIRDGVLEEYKGNKNPIGYFIGLAKEFTSIEIPLQPGDTFYMLSDGYTDQFGGENIKKFNRKRFKKLLLSIQEYDLKKQKEILCEAFQLWKGKSEQIDDVTVMGLRV
ncbi:MAG: SpoIIE family protein phosphatase [Flavobacteriales bacterium]|nr:SpoIIE family protein phosphatase [Flavobacteriales bacterium]